MPTEETDPLNEPTGDTPSTSPEPRGNIVCEFCKCRLTKAKGEVLEFSPEAKDYRRHAQTKEELEGVISTLRQEKEALEAQVRELSPAPQRGSGTRKAFSK